MVLNSKVQEFAYINQVAQEIQGGAVIYLTIWKVALKILHSALAVSHSLVSAFDIWNVGSCPKCSSAAERKELGN